MQTSKLILGVSFTSAVLLSPSAWALPLASAQDDGVRSLSRPGDDMAFAEVDFTAIVALSNCSGALVRFHGSKPNDKALILTNGHCLEGGMPAAGEVIVDRASQRRFQLLNANGRGNLGSLHAERLVYATMTDTDMALYRLNETFQRIEARFGIEALTIADEHPQVGMDVSIASGYWRRIYSCSIDTFVHELHEDEWVFKDSIRFSQPGCEMIGGTSGSPIIHVHTKEVVGVNNTGNESGGRCTMNNPCEVDEDGTVVATRGAAYGQNIYQIYGCLTADHQLDLTLSSCQLPQPK